MRSGAGKRRSRFETGSCRRDSRAFAQAISVAARPRTGAGLGLKKSPVATHRGIGRRNFIALGSAAWNGVDGTSTARATPIPRHHFGIAASGASFLDGPSSANGSNPGHCPASARARRRCRAVRSSWSGVCRHRHARARRVGKRAVWPQRNSVSNRRLKRGVVHRSQRELDDHLVECRWQRLGRARQPWFLYGRLRRRVHSTS
jgi:hypothetical protein